MSCHGSSDAINSLVNAHKITAAARKRNLEVFSEDFRLLLALNLKCRAIPVHSTRNQGFKTRSVAESGLLHGLPSQEMNA